ncbi:MAG TPA: hypothetical protein VFD62_19770 [Pyrinomonadaceae bacterium]|nr:hypothetical protein [Pyrinomonadaceae bacterium]
MPKAKAKKKKEPRLTKERMKKARKPAKDRKPLATGAATAEAAAASQPCLDALDAAFIVGGCLPSGTHENDDTLEQTGLISENLRLIFRECVFNGVTNRGCDITRGQIPNGANTTVGEVQDTIIRNAH